MNNREIKKELKAFASSEKAKILQGFFKTGKGEYGEGDIFIGVKVPDIRSLVKKYRKETDRIPLALFRSRIHEERLFALLSMVDIYKKEDNIKKEAIYKIYLNNTKYINNWDLVDLSAPTIIGEHLFEKYKKNKEKGSLFEISPVMTKLASSDSLWERRIAIVATFCFIKKSDSRSEKKTILKAPFLICNQLMGDKEDLVHKACGWMLREAGKRDRKRLERFLMKNYNKMPRTMLRYSIERFPEKIRKKYLNMGKRP